MKDKAQEKSMVFDLDVGQGHEGVALFDNTGHQKWPGIYMYAYMLQDTAVTPWVMPQMPKLWT